jgi:predicted amidohydrolase YtcJ
VDLLVTNANVLTMDGRGAPASAVAIHAGKIVAVGSDGDVAAYRRPGMRVIDAGGRTVLPGFIEPHNHMVGYGTALIGVDARTPPNETIADIVARVRQAAAALPSHRWILGRGYDDTGLRDMRHPTRRDLDQASTEHRS